MIFRRPSIPDDLIGNFSWKVTVSEFVRLFGLLRS